MDPDDKLYEARAFAGEGWKQAATWQAIAERAMRAFDLAQMTVRMTARALWSRS